MAHTPASEDVETVRITREMNDHRTMTVEVVDTNSTRYLVEYASSDLERTLAALPVGATVPLELEPVGVRANVWRAVDMHAEPSDRRDKSARLVD
ncbi:hypothetical protein SAMN04487948_106180 [Halogranum amylolyticum]|uniref:DUF7999 domain-containing protein n=1 Tax=Halogranum amylolyticum TaxID=660520 RepID=A0A1H8TDP9_9EURY|nr:hypothetical protein [Halogranum amylolyticum]SEO88628.1 hypothetical protein SAMN04487948_106180 [Halogranum amylolyticum]